MTIGMRYGARAIAALTFAGLGYLAEGPALAQTPTVESANEAPVIYPPEFFARYAPRTALDMVTQVPGFSLDEGDEERRGFSGAAGNVRIDGAQPSAKSQSIEDILSRIPASDVLRIELLRGESSPGVSAQSSFVNVVRRPGAGGKVVWTAGAEITDDGLVGPLGEAAWTKSFGDIQFALGISHEQERKSEDITRRTFNAFDVLQGQRFEISPRIEKESRVNAEASTPALGGALTLTGQLAYREESDDTFGVFTSPTGAPLGARDDTSAATIKTYEIGLTYERPLGAWALELTSLATRSTEESEETTTARTAAGAFDESAQQDIGVDTGETIGRAVLSRKLSGVTLSMGAEAAFNSLEQNLRLTENIGAGPVPVVLPSANVLVEEKRAEAFVTLSLQPAANWTVEATAAAETSQLTQTGDVNQTTDLTYWKPSLQVVRKFGEANQLRMRIYRDIGQLDFGDFVSAAEFNNNLVIGGNPDLKPETSWRLEAAGDLRFGPETSLEIMLFRHWYEDVIDVVPIGAPGALIDAPGNIGKGDLYGVRAAFSTPLPILPGAKLTAETTVQESSVRDLLTGEKRANSEGEEVFASLSFRQDLPARKFSWGASYELTEVAPTYRLDEIETERGDFDWEVFAETTAIAGYTLRGWVTEVSGPPQRRTRYFFDPDRRGFVDRIERRRIEPGLAFGVSLSGSF